MIGSISRIIFYSQYLDPCASSHTLTFDDIGTNPYWLGGSGYGAVLAGYGGFTWFNANYLNVSRHSAFGTPLVSGGYVAYIDNLNVSNVLTISTNTSAHFYICSLVMAAATIAQTPLTISGFLSNTMVFTTNVTVNSTTPSILNFTNQPTAVDTIQMFAYGNIFSFDNLVVNGPSS